MLELAKGDDGVISDAEAKQLLLDVESGIKKQYPQYKIEFPADNSVIVKAIKDGECSEAGKLIAAPNGMVLVESETFNEDKSEAHAAILADNTSCKAIKPSTPGFEGEKTTTKGVIPQHCIGCVAQPCSKYWVYFKSAANLKPDWYQKEQYTSADYKGKTWAIDGPYNLTGGNQKFFNSTPTEKLGSYVNVDQSKFFGNNPDREKSGVGKFRFVNTNSQFLLVNEGYFKSEQELVNQLLGDFIHCTGPENIVFPHNGKFAKIMTKSIAVGDIISRWAKTNFAARDPIAWAMDLKGEINVNAASGLTSLEHFMGSVAVRIDTRDKNNVTFELFNITSFTSGYLTKDLPIIGRLVDSPNSTVRDMRKQSYSNISQYVSFSLTPAEINKIVNQFCTGNNCSKYNP